jgi:serine/threonine-protein kinase
MLASISAVPVTVGFMIATGRTLLSPTPSQFFVAFVFPYLLVVVLGYVCAHVVYDLGKEVTRAQDLGSYHLVERLGQGGMGEVWKARHRLLARPAAIKLIRPSLIEQSGDIGGLVRRFEREAQVTAQLQSPHTVELFDFGVANDGGFYYVMELLDGLDLDALVKRYGPVPAERAIHMLRQVCHSLGEAESKGLVHRDIKPSNIFACRYGGDHDFIKVLTGQLVFTADSVMDAIMQHAHTAPTPPSQRSELAIPPALDDLVLSCLAKDPANRPQTAAELSRRLAGIPCASRWSDERARDWWSAHRPESAPAA